MVGALLRNKALSFTDEAPFKSSIRAWPSIRSPEVRECVLEDNAFFVRFFVIAFTLLVGVYFDIIPEEEPFRIS